MRVLISQSLAVRSWTHGKLQKSDDYGADRLHQVICFIADSVKNQSFSNTATVVQAEVHVSPMKRKAAKEKGPSKKMPETMETSKRRGSIIYQCIFCFR
jgi:hypothetical protein